MLSIIKEALDFLTWYHNPPQFFTDIWRSRGWHPTSYQKRFFETATRDENRFILIMSGCGIGKTLSMATLGLWYTLVYSRIRGHPMRVLIAAGAKQQSDILYNYIKDAIRENPWISDLLAKEPTKSLTEFKDGSWIRPATCSQRFIFGHHPDIFIIDEAVLVPDVILIDAVFRVAPSMNCKLIIASTPYDYTSFFVEMWNDTERFNQFIRFHWSSEEAYWITNDVKKLAKSLPKDQFQIRFLGLPVAKSTVFFPYPSIKACRIMEDDYQTLLEKPGEYHIGVDWGWKHPTAIIVVKRIDDEYLVVHAEAKSGLSGDEVLDWVTSVYREWGATQIYADAEKRWEIMRLQQRGLPIYAVKFQSEKKVMLTNLKALITNKRIYIPYWFEDLLKQLANYIPERKRNDDYVDALMLAVRQSIYFQEYETQGLLISSGSASRIQKLVRYYSQAKNSLIQGK